MHILDGLACEIPWQQFVDPVDRMLGDTFDLTYHIQVKIGTQVSVERFARPPDVVTADLAPIGVEEERL